MRRIETVIQWVSNAKTSQAWCADFFVVEPTPYEEPYLNFSKHAYVILASSAPGTERAGGVGFEVEDVDAAYAELSDRGYVFNEEPFDIQPGRLITINDPNSTSWD